MGLSVAIISRIYCGEGPYLFVFIDYYLNIGISKFYFVICEKVEEDVLKLFLRKYEKYIHYFVHENGLEHMDKNVFDGCENIVEEDYLLNVDIDEFMYLKYKDKFYDKIQDFIKENQYDKYHFDWIMVVNDGISKNTEGFVKKKMGKTMIKVKNGIEKITCHDFELKNKNIKIFYDEMYIIHYWGRTFEDIIIKCLCGKLSDKKRTNLKEMVDEIYKKRLPVRFKMLALLSKVKKDIIVPNFIIDNINYKVESNLVEKFLLKDCLFRATRILNADFISKSFL